MVKKDLISSLVSIMILLVLQNHTSHAAEITDYVYGLCNRATYSSNSSFSRNLNTVVGVLNQQASKSYYHYTVANNSDPSDNTTFVYALFQCRNDISNSDCASCVSGIFTAAYCGAAIGMRIQLLGCYVRYESSSFLGFEENFITSNCSSATSSNAIYQANLITALNRTVTAAAAGKDKNYFNSSSVGTTNSTTAYGLAQCLAYLTPSECATCLSQYSSRSTICGNSVSGFVYYTTCYYRFDQSPLVFSTSTSTSPPTSPSTGSPPPSPSVSPPSDSLPEGSSKSPSLSPSATVTTSSPSGKKSTIGVAVGVSVGVVALLAVIAAIFSLLLKKRHKQKQIGSSPGHAISDPGTQILTQGAPKFSIEELQEATGDFNPDNKLGQGGFGPVYKGTLRNGREVAIKILSAGSGQGKSEFMNEAQLITSVQHRNLIQLLGYCVENSQRLLVYEYLPHRSLDLHLFRPVDRNLNVLDWKSRFNIIIGIARGLSYLHEDSHVKIVHRDIKASNILLDNNLSPKISDFGLARLVQDDVTHVTTKVAGTMGYLAPEYAIGGHLSEKADVYSYGLVALEIISGRKVVEREEDPNSKHILEWAWELYERQEQVLMADLTMKEVGRVNEDELVRVVHVALLCTQSNPAARPAMSQVYTMLCSKSTILDNPTKPTTMFGMMSPIHSSTASSGSRPSMPSSSLSSSVAGAPPSGNSNSHSIYSKTQLSSTTNSSETDSITNVYPR